jgi:3-carboxy-cis,cis-muconate cycloisomerase
VRPSSSRSDVFAGVLRRAPTQDWLQAMLDFEAGLARAQARAGVISPTDAERIAAACRAELYDAAELDAGIGNPAGPLVQAIRARVDAPVHKGATSQDTIDTAAMLVAKRALPPLLADLHAAADAAAALARAHRDTPMAGRTLLQQAVPTTFGLKAAGWMSGLDDARARLAAFRPAVQLGGAAGTLAALGDDGLAVLAALAQELDLAEPALPWHTLRGRVGELAGALGIAAGAIAKPARDVTLLAQTEVGEAREAASGGSSAMPHKRNPVAAVAALGCAGRAPGLVATLLAAMAQEHERAAGAWHAEWAPFSDLLTAVASAAAWLRQCLEGLEPDTARMRANLELTGGAIVAERVAAELGRAAADEVVARAGDAGSFAAALAERAGAAEAARLLDPSTYLGSAAAFVDRALEARP